MTSRVSKLDAVLVVAGIAVWAGFTLYIVNRLLAGQVGKLHELAQNGVTVGAFMACTLLNVILVYAVLGRRETTGAQRLLVAAVLLVAGLADIAVLYGTWHGAQPVAV